MNKILLKYDKIFIDTSTFLINMDNIFNSNQYINKFTNEKSDHHVQKQLFIESLIPFLNDNKKKINIPYEVINEIKSSEKSLEPKLNNRASNALKILKVLKDNKCLDIYRGENYPFTDNIFITVLFRYMTKYNMCLITQDRNLADDVSSIKEFRSITTPKMISAYIVGFKSNGDIHLFKNKKRLVPNRLI